MAVTDIPGAVPRRRLADRLRNVWAPLVFMAPATILVVVFFFVPVILILGLALTNMSTSTGYQNWRWIGLDNLARIIKYPDTKDILWATIKYVALTLSLFNVGLALVVALLSTHVPRGAGFLFRTLWLLPRLTPSVVYILMWRWIGAPGPYGILNRHILGPLGVPNQNLVTGHAWVFVILVNGFIGASFGMIIFTSAIESIPKDYMMAALVDGASIWQRIRFVILPMLRWPLLFVTTYQTLSLLTSFEQIMLLTDGAQGTEVWALWAYHRALSTYFGQFQWGFGAALAAVLVVIGLIMAVVYMRYFRFDQLLQEPKIEAL